jgi:hypothetical protein
MKTILCGCFLLLNTEGQNFSLFLEDGWQVEWQKTRSQPPPPPGELELKSINGFDVAFALAPTTTHTAIATYDPATEKNRCCICNANRIITIISESAKRV